MGREDEHVYFHLRTLPDNPTAEDVDTLIAAAESVAAHLEERAESLRKAVADLQQRQRQRGANRAQINEAAGVVLRRMNL